MNNSTAQIISELITTVETQNEGKEVNQIALPLDSMSNMLGAASLNDTITMLIDIARAFASNEFRSAHGDWIGNIIPGGKYYIMKKLQDGTYDWINNIADDIAEARNTIH